eukprot:m.25034 g.25034  ORF g.25034 m.25034 type:complete len:956 (-) comp4204_c0_seq1:112-2979(-)
MGWRILLLSMVMLCCSSLNLHLKGRVHFEERVRGEARVFAVWSKGCRGKMRELVLLHEPYSGEFELHERQMTSNARPHPATKADKPIVVVEKGDGGRSLGILRCRPPPTTTTTANDRRQRQQSHATFTRINAYMDECRPMVEGKIPMGMSLEHAAVGRAWGGDATSVLQLLAVLEYGAMYGTPTMEAAAWEVAVAADGVSLEDAAHCLWFVALSAASGDAASKHRGGTSGGSGSGMTSGSGDGNVISAVRSACFAVVRVPALLAAVVKRGRSLWPPGAGERVLRRLASHRHVVARAESAWASAARQHTCSIETECRHALARHGLMGTATGAAPPPDSTLPVLNSDRVNRTLTDVFRVTDDSECDALDYRSTLDELHRLLSGGMLEWTVSSVAAHRGVAILLDSVATLARRSATCTPSRDRATVILLYCCLEDWITVVLRNTPLAPAVAQDTVRGRTLADVIIAALLRPPDTTAAASSAATTALATSTRSGLPNGTEGGRGGGRSSSKTRAAAVASKDDEDGLPGESFDMAAVVGALEDASPSLVRTTGAAVGAQLYLAESAGYPRDKLGEVAMRLLRSAPAIYARAVVWLAGQVGRLDGQGEGGGKDGRGRSGAFIALCRAVNPALVTWRNAGPDPNGCQLAAATALAVARPVLAARASLIDSTLHELAKYAHNAAMALRECITPSVQSLAAQMIPHAAVELVAGATSCRNGHKGLDLHGLACGPLNTAWVVDVTARGVSKQVDPATAHALSDVAFAFAVHSVAVCETAAVRLIEEALPAACADMTSEAHAHALGRLVARVVAVLRPSSSSSSHDGGSMANEANGPTTDHGRSNGSSQEGRAKTPFVLAVRSVLSLCVELFRSPAHAASMFPVHLVQEAGLALGPTGLVPHGVVSEEVKALASEVAHGLRLHGAVVATGALFDLSRADGRDAFAALLARPPLRGTTDTSAWHAQA